MDHLVVKLRPNVCGLDGQLSIFRVRLQNTLTYHATFAEEDLHIILRRANGLSYIWPINDAGRLREIIDDIINRNDGTGLTPNGEDYHGLSM